MALAIVLGAMGAHSLERHLTPEMLDSFETGVRYHIYHALALLVVSAVADRLHKNRLKIATVFMLTGTLFFSGSIYLFTVGNLIETNFAKLLWWVTPLGGVLLIAAWGLLITASAQRAKNLSA